MQSSDGILNSFRHFVNCGLLCDFLISDNGIHCGFHSREILVVILIQGIYLVYGCIHFGIVSRVSSKYRIELALRESTAKQVGNCAVGEFLGSL